VICISICMLDWNICSRSKLNRKTQTCVSSKMHFCWDTMSGRLKYRYRRSRGYVQRTNKMHTFFINDLIQLYCLWHVSNNQVFILRKIVQAALWCFITHLYKQSGRWQDVLDNKHILTSTRHPAYTDAWKKYHKSVCICLFEDEHMDVLNMSKKI